MRALALSFLLSLQSVVAAQATETVMPAKSHRIVMYTTKTCGYCERARQYFVQHQFSWKEIDIQGSAEAAEQFARLGGRGTPLIFIDEQRIAGFDAQRIESLLAR